MWFNPGGWGVEEQGVGFERRCVILTAIGVIKKNCVIFKKKFGINE